MTAAGNVRMACRHIEANLSANVVRDVVRRLLGGFDIHVERMQVLLREDRDAGRAGNGT